MAARKPAVVEELSKEELEAKIKGVDKKGIAPEPYHIMIRYVSELEIPERNMFRADTVVSHIKTWTDKGYIIHTSQYTGKEREQETGAIVEVLYFLFEYVG